ncbi:hypothetical protein OIU84_013173 [Salix udensis]|uniref:40S ribosomal protein S6 n=1 Tax=Salix udensis TaxID=889485 RepID=A0AAD6NU45_9ROSI|nr:hypothetical protein OIU84_013173 [Salix udensis]
MKQGVLTPGRVRLLLHRGWNPLASVDMEGAMENAGENLCAVALETKNERRSFTTKSGKKVSKAPKIQRLVTPLTLQRKRARISDKKKRIAKAKSEAADYQKLLATRLREQRERRSESLAKKRSRLSVASKPSIPA